MYFMKVKPFKFYLFQEFRVGGRLEELQQMIFVTAKTQHLYMALTCKRKWAKVDILAYCTSAKTVSYICTATIEPP